VISYLEGILMRDRAGTAVVVQTTSDGVALDSRPIPNGMHPLAARGVGRRYEELGRAASRGARVLLTIENDDGESILEIDEIEPVAASEIAAARNWLATPGRLAA